MFALSDNTIYGTNNGRVVLIDKDQSMPIKYLTREQSLTLFSLMHYDSLEECAQFLSSETKNTMSILKVRQFISDNQYYLKQIEFPYEKQIDASNTLLHRMANPHKKNRGNEFRLDYPSKLVWIPTLKCNRSCLYCGVDRKNVTDEESQIPFAVIMQRMEEAVRNGVSYVTLHGGEPLFCYDDNIFIIIEYLRRHDVEVNISTKNHISPKMADRLAKAGLNKIQLSLDSIDEDTVESLYCEKGYLARFRETVANLKRANIEVDVNTVISTINYTTVPDLLVYLTELGVDSLTLSQFRSGGASDGDFSLSLNQRTWLFKEIRKRRYRFRFKKFTFYPYEPDPVPASQRPVCESCRVSLLILPDGKCCYCDFLSRDSRFILGDLNNQTFEEIWYSEKVEGFFNFPASLRDSSQCSACVGFEDCMKRGICFLKTDKEQLLSPDYLCVECGGRA